MHLLYYTGIAVAIVIGAFTHQIWDAFTHQGRWGTQWIPSLNSDFPVGRHLIPGYKLLQYGSTFVGLPFLAILAAFELNRATPHDYETPTLPTKAKLLAASLAFVIPLAIGIFTYSTQASAYQALGITIKRSGAIIILLCLGYCVVFQTCTHGDAMRSKR